MKLEVLFIRDEVGEGDVTVEVGWTMESNDVLRVIAANKQEVGGVGKEKRLEDVSSVCCLKGVLVVSQYKHAYKERS